MKIAVYLIASSVLILSCDKKAETLEEIANFQKSDSLLTKVTDSTVQKPNEILSSSETAENIGGKPALNPAHGQPFHRCDIAVGAPIDSAPQQNIAPQTLSQQRAENTNFNTAPIAPSTTAAVSTPQAIGPKPALNPAHGEPYHRCDLQVGAPLT